VNLDEVDPLLASAEVSMDIRKSVVHRLGLTSVFEDQQPLEYSLFVLMVDLIKINVVCLFIQSN
jgi:hypothetical protein